MLWEGKRIRWIKGSPSGAGQSKGQQVGVQRYMKGIAQVREQSAV